MKVIIQNFSDSWTDTYEELSNDILRADKDNIIRLIEHVGSTSVKGITAKPVIDIMISTDSEENLDKLPVMFDKLGYKYIKEYEVQLPYRRFFYKNQEDKRIANIHCVTGDHEFRTNDIIFRDYIREDEKTRQEYIALKTQLSQYEWNDSNEYNEAKTEFILNKKKEALKFFTLKTEAAECEAFYNMFDNIDSEIKSSQGIKSRRFKKGTMICYPPAQIILLNRVIGTGLYNYLNRKDAYYFLNYFEGIDKFAVQVTPFTRPENVNDFLESKKIIDYSHWVRLYRSTDNISENQRNDIEIRKVKADEADEYAAMIQDAFDFPESTKDIFKLAIGDKNWILYFVIHKGKKAATAGAFINGDTAWIGMAATLPEFRGKGLQSALINARLKATKEKGCKWISVETAPAVNKDGLKNQSYYNLLRNGFVKLYERRNFIRFTEPPIN